MLFMYILWVMMCTGDNFQKVCRSTRRIYTFPIFCGNVHTIYKTIKYHYRWNAHTLRVMHTFSGIRALFVYTRYCQGSMYLTCYTIFKNTFPVGFTRRTRTPGKHKSDIPCISTYNNVYAPEIYLYTCITPALYYLLIRSRQVNVYAHVT
jgi:hypothetical protein